MKLWFKMTRAVLTQEGSLPIGMVSGRWGRSLIDLSSMLGLCCVLAKQSFYDKMGPGLGAEGGSEKWLGLYE